jgi:hypothetical protein
MDDALLNFKLDTFIELLRDSEPTVFAESPPEEIIRNIDNARKGKEVDKEAIETLLLPTAALQEIAIDNGWGKEFNSLAADISYLLNRESERERGKESTEVLFRKFIQALGQQTDTKIIYEYYKKLYKTGADAVPLIERYLLSADWSKIRYQPQVALVCGVFSLLHDIDENKSIEVARTVLPRSRNSPKQISKCITYLVSQTSKNYYIYRVRNITVYISKHFTKHKKIAKRLAKWLSVIPPRRIRKIERIYIVSDKESSRYAGTYTPILDVIMVYWTQKHTFLRWINNFHNEFVLYHEIGHFVNKHTFGQIRQQEDEADNYAFNIMRKKHILFDLQFTLYKLLGYVV